MDQRINVITLGVADVPRAKKFYERLGWGVGFTDGDIVMFQAGPMIFSLWGREQLAEDGGVSSPGSGWGGFTLGYAVGSRAEVDEVCRDAREAGSTQTAGPQEKFFGYSGVFADPDGHTWEVSFVNGWTLRADGSVSLS